MCALNLKSQPLAELLFQKNGTQLGIAKRFDSGPKGLEITDSPLKKLSWESTIFPHALLNWSDALQDGNGIIGPQFSSKKECELPGPRTGQRIIQISDI